VHTFAKTLQVEGIIQKFPCDSVYLPRNLFQLYTTVHTRNLEQNRQGGYEITYMSCVENAKLCEKHVVVLRLFLIIPIHIPNTRRDVTFKKMITNRMVENVLVT
jgi:hypothetical protein